MKTVVFRVKGGKGYGWGHVVRMVVIADFMKNKLNDLEINFVVEGSREVLGYVQQNGFAVYEVPFDLDIRKERSCWPFEEAIFLLIVDLHRAEEDRVKILREKSKQLVIFSDMGLHYPFADILIYPQLLGPNTGERKLDQIILRGPKYFILDREHPFLRSKPKKILPQAKRLLVCLGGTTHPAELLKLAQSILPIQGMFEVIDFIVGYEGDSELLSALHKSLPKAHFIQSTPEMAQLLYKADIAIIAGGFLKYESAAVGTPTIIVSLVEHQHELSIKFSDTRVAEYIGRISELEAKQIRNSVTKLSQDCDTRRKMSCAGKQLVDGLALERFISLFSKLGLNGLSSSIGLRAEQ